MFMKSQNISQVSNASGFFYKLFCNGLQFLYLLFGIHANNCREIKLQSYIIWTKNVMEQIFGVKILPAETYMIFNALAKVVTTKGSESQNHGRRLGITSIMIITIAEMKKYNHHFPDSSGVFI